MTWIFIVVYLLSAVAVFSFIRSLSNPPFSLTDNILCCVLALIWIVLPLCGIAAALYDVCLLSLDWSFRTWKKLRNQ